MVSRSEAIVWSAVFMTEALTIVAGNVFSIVKFTGTGKLHRRSSYLLINLAAADTLVGACAVPMFVYFIGGQAQLWPVSLETPLTAYKAVDVISGLASILSLTLISLERLWATWWPLRHRLIRTREYVVGIMFVWFLAFAIVVIELLTRHIPLRFIFYSSVVILSICCVIVFVTNLVIWIQVGNRKISSHFRNATLQERRLTITLLIVTLISLCAWLPFTILNIVNQLQPVSVSLSLIYLTKLLHYGNSCANVFVYSLRIAEFKRAFTKMLCRDQSFISEKAVLLRAQVARLSKDTTALEMGILKSNRLKSKVKNLKGSLIASWSAVDNRTCLLKAGMGLANPIFNSEKALPIHIQPSK